MSKRAYYFQKNFNWKEINNLFCYDVKFPERLSKKQQVLRLYKSCLRRAFEEEMIDFRMIDLHSYTKKCAAIREDFKKLRNVEDVKVIDEMLEKYEFYIENSYQINVYTHDNVAYEWRHGKGFIAFDKDSIETDSYGYYDAKLLSYYPNPREWQFRDEYPMDDSQSLLNDFSPSYYWKDVQDEVNVTTDGVVKTPEEFEQEVRKLREKYGNGNNLTSMI